ncbi:prolyl oligopeptidase family serine peptidase [Candidatus Riflebacteria bacterium]
MSFLQKCEFKKARQLFSKGLQTEFTPDEFKAIWAAHKSKSGDYHRLPGCLILQEHDGITLFFPGRFGKKEVDIQLYIDREGKISTFLFCPPEVRTAFESNRLNFMLLDYVRSEKFIEHEVTFGAGDYKLPGTLTLPVGSGPFPVVILVHGTGPNDRNESIGPNKPFKDIATGLAGQEIAVFRYEKRTRLYPDKCAVQEDFTVWEETVYDAVEAMKMLMRVKKIDSKNIFLLGHSLGGALVPRIAKKGQLLKGFIILAGSTRLLEDMVLEQLNYIFNLDAVISRTERKSLYAVQKVVREIKKLYRNEEVSTDKFFNAGRKYWLDLKNYKPAAAARKLKRPLLILQGRRDYQVTMQDFNNWKQSLNGRRNVVFKSYPALNHFFIYGKGKSSPAEYKKKGYVSLQVIHDIVDWVKENTD